MHQIHENQQTGHEQDQSGHSLTWQNEYPLPKKASAFCERMINQITTLQTQLNGALSLICEQEGLNGQWTLDWPARKLVRMDKDPNG
jgi:hypothetical protein